MAKRRRLTGTRVAADRTARQIAFLQHVIGALTQCLGGDVTLDPHMLQAVDGRGVSVALGPDGSVRLVLAPPRVVALHDA